MRISSINSADTVVTQLRRLSDRQTELQRQIATGQRVERPGDDPAAVGRLIGARMERGSLDQFARNASAALEYSKSSYTALDQMKKVSDRASELAVLGQGALSPDAKRAYAAELNQLIEQASTLGNTRFGDDHVFAGSALDTEPFVLARDSAGRIASVAYAGDTRRLTIPLADNATLQPTPDSATNTGLADFMNGLVALRDALYSSDSAAISAARPALDTAEDLLVSALSEHGAVQVRIEVAQAWQRSRLDEIDRQVSEEADADLPDVIVRLNQTTQAYEAALSSSSNLLRLSLLDYLR